MPSPNPENQVAEALPPVISRLQTGRQWLNYYLALFGLRGQGGRLLLGLLLLAWLAAGIYRVEPDEQGVVLRFGRWVETTGPGLHYHWPFPVETILLPKVTKLNQIQLGNNRTLDGTPDPRDKQMLTGDENIVEADCVVFWRIKDAGQYLFKVNNPESFIKTTAESALREVISRTPIQSAMSDKRQQIADETRNLLQDLLDHANAGVLVTQVQLERVDPPAAVIDAFNDVQRARADMERARNEAQAYANDVLPRARGEAARISQEAAAYKSQVVNLAEGDAKSFTPVYQSYLKAKDATAWRMYLDSMDELLRKSTRVIIDTSGKGMNGVTPYLPLTDKAAGKEAKK